MTEIGVTDLSAATQARFGSSQAAQAAIDAVLVAARHYCGWHVSPVRVADQFTLDGPGGQVLDLPTRQLVALNAVTEDGAVIDVTKLDWSENGAHGAPVRKQSAARWSDRYRSILVDADHGYTEAAAADWRRAIVGMVDKVSYETLGATDDGPLKRKRVDDVEYEWFDFGVVATAAVYASTSVLDFYRLREVLFV